MDYLIPFIFLNANQSLLKILRDGIQLGFSQYISLPKNVRLYDILYYMFIRILHVKIKLNLSLRFYKFYFSILLLSNDLHLILVPSVLKESYAQRQKFAL